MIGKNRIFDSTEHFDRINGEISLLTSSISLLVNNYAKNIYFCSVMKIDVGVTTTYYKKMIVLNTKVIASSCRVFFVVLDVFLQNDQNETGASIGLG